MDQVLWAALGIVASVVVGFAADAIQDRRGRRAHRALAAGAERAVPMLILPPARPRAGWWGWLVPTGRMVRGSAVRVGDTLDISARRWRIIQPVDVFGPDTVRRYEVDDRRQGIWEGDLFVFADRDGAQWLAGPQVEWHEAFDELVAPSRASRAGEGGARPRPPWRTLGWGAWAALAVVALSVLSAGVGVAAWQSGRDVTAKVTSVDAEYGLCMVSWVEDGTPRDAEVSCPSESTALGETVAVRSFWPPLPEDAIARDVGDGWADLSLLLAPGVLAGVWLLVRRPWRRAPALVLTPVRRSVPAGAIGPVDAASADAHDSLPALIETVARTEGWDRQPATEAPKNILPQRISMVTPRWPFWVAAIALAIAWLPEWTPLWQARALSTFAALVVLWGLTVAVRTWRRVASVSGEPVTSEWDYIGLKLLNEWLVMLVLGDTIHWVVAFDRTHPAVRGRAGVRGDLTDGGAIELVIDGATWVPVGPVVRFGADDEPGVYSQEQDLREMLTERLAENR